MLMLSFHMSSACLNEFQCIARSSMLAWKLPGRARQAGEG